MTRIIIQSAYKAKVDDRHELEIFQNATDQLQGASKAVGTELKERQDAGTRTEQTSVAEAKSGSSYSSLSPAPSAFATLLPSESFPVYISVPISTRLTPGATKRMQDEFHRNYKSYQGESWTISPRSNIDEIMYVYTMPLNEESCLHSFVIDTNNSATLGALTEDKDQELIKTLN
ncbi:hypothetical protein BGZ49_002810 [Haplosporangium sp. Z 27]|nr:hypothetical protein BGZ49_002810 [Haplosporangium sp. Z 27]